MSASFDWVTERFNCSLDGVFKELELAVKTDVDTVNRLEAERAGEAGGALMRNIGCVSAGRRFSVSRSERGGNVLRSVNFAVEPASISIKSDYDGGPAFVATIRLNSDGRCLLVVGDVEMELWQVRRKALEDLFFGGPHQPLVTVSARRRT
jgi:hypothetical protein